MPALRCRLLLLSLGLLAAAAPASSAAERVTLEAERLAAEPPLRPLPRFTAQGRPSLALALSGGGARGLAHLGVLLALEEEGIEVDAIAGTSAGALVGAFVAAGYHPGQVIDLLGRPELDEVFGGLDHRRSGLPRDEDFARSSAQVRFRHRRREEARLPAGLFPVRAADRELQRLLLLAQVACGGDFDRLAIPFRAVATDLVSGEKVAPSQGELVALLRGSATVPGVVAPVPLGRALLVDGGLRENVPVETARTLGTDLVVAVDVSQRLEEAAKLDGLFDAIDRSLDIMMDAKTRESLALADFVLRPEVGDLPRTDARRQLDRLVVAGREAVAARRDELWGLLEDTAGAELIRIDRIEVSGTDWLPANELSDRLGGLPALVSAWRIRAELARALNRGPLAAGHAELLEPDGPDGPRQLRFVFREHEPFEELRREGPGAEPGARLSPEKERVSLALERDLAWELRQQLLREGRPLAFLAESSFEGASGTLVQRFDEIGVESLRTEAAGDARLAWTSRRVSKLTGPRFDFDRLSWRLDDLVARGAVRRWSLQPEQGENDELGLVARLTPDAYDELALGGSFRGALRWGGFLRLARVNLGGQGDAVQLTLTGATEQGSIDLRYRHPGGLGLRTLGFEVGARWYDDAVPLVSLKQRYLEERADPNDGALAWLSLLHRGAPGRSLEAGLLHERRRLPDTLSGEAPIHRRTALFLRQGLDRQDRLLFPTRGGLLSLDGELGLGGPALWSAQLSGNWAIALDAARRTVFVPRAGLGFSGGAEHRSFWLDPGGHRELYGFVPYGGLAREYAHAGFALRRRVLDRGPLELWVESGVDALRRAEELDDLDEGKDVLGYGLSFVASIDWLGPLTVGVSRNDEGAEIYFLTLGYPFLRR